MSGAPDGTIGEKTREQVVYECMTQAGSRIRAKSQVHESTMRSCFTVVFYYLCHRFLFLRYKMFSWFLRV